MRITELEPVRYGHQNLKNGKYYIDENNKFLKEKRNADFCCRNKAVTL